MAFPVRLYKPENIPDIISNRVRFPEGINWNTVEGLGKSRVTIDKTVKISEALKEKLAHL